MVFSGCCSSSCRCDLQFVGSTVVPGKRNGELVQQKKDNFFKCIAESSTPRMRFVGFIYRGDFNLYKNYLNPNGKLWGNGGPPWNRRKEKEEEL